MRKEDLIMLIEVCEDLKKLDYYLEQITGLGHSDGSLKRIDNIFLVVQHYVHPYYSITDPIVPEDPEAYAKREDWKEPEGEFYRIVQDKDLSAEEKAELLLNPGMRYNR